MKVKIDTKEKFRIIQVDEAQLDANLADELSELLLSRQPAEPPNLILELSKVTEIDAKIAQVLLTAHQVIYERQASFILSGAGAGVTLVLTRYDTDRRLTCVPTLSEAVDMVMMEEMERELFRDDDQS